MINFRKLKLVILLVLLFSLTLPAFVFANDTTDTTSDVITELKKREGPLGSVQDEVSKFSRDIFNIVRLVVVAVLVVSLFMNFAAFSKAGDNPGLKAALNQNDLGRDWCNSCY